MLSKLTSSSSDVEVEVYPLFGKDKLAAQTLAFSKESPCCTVSLMDMHPLDRNTSYQVDF